MIDRKHEELERSHPPDGFHQGACWSKQAPHCVACGEEISGTMATGTFKQDGCGLEGLTDVGKSSNVGLAAPENSSITSLVDFTVLFFGRSLYGIRSKIPSKEK